MSRLLHAEVIEQYFANLKSKGLKVPRDGSKSIPSLLAISNATGVSYSLLKKKKYRSYINPLIQEIGLGDSVVLDETQFRDARELKNLQKLEKYFQLISNNGQKLPEHPRRKGEVDIGLLAHEAGIPHGVISGTKSLRERIREAHKNLGCEVRVLDAALFRGTANITYKELKKYGTEQRKKEVGKDDRQAVYNTRSHLKKWMEGLNLTLVSAVGSELAGEFKSQSEQVSENIPNLNTRKNFTTEINRWQGYYKDMVGLQDVPKPFDEALNYFIQKKQITIQHLARISGVPDGVIRRWSLRLATPRGTSVPHVYALEESLDAPAGSLVEKLPRSKFHNRFRRVDLPDFIGKNDSIRRRVYAYLPPDFLTLGEEEQKKVVNYILTQLISSGSEIAKRLPELTKLPYALKVRTWPTSLLAEKENLVDVKMSLTPPIGMIRKKRWRNSTKNINISFYEGIFGALSASRESENIKTRGLGVPLEHLTFGLFVCAELIQWFFKFRFEIRHGVYNSAASTMLSAIIALIQTDYGWIRQSPHLASRLHPIEGFIDEDFIELAKRDWNGVCDAALKFYRIHNRTLREIEQVTRDPFGPIKGIVESDNPMDYEDMFVEAVKANLPNQHTAPILYATGLRNSIADRILSITGLRERNLVELTYRDDNQGELRKVKDRYVLVISRFKFKHPDSPYFGPKTNKGNFYHELLDLHDLYKDLDEYLAKYRPLLLNHFHGGKETDILLVNTGKTIRISEKNFYIGYKRRTGIHMAENKLTGTGIKNVRPYGPHSTRHIRGTHTAKKTHSMEEAGNVNQQSAKMAEKHYVDYASKDKTKRANEILFPNKQKSRK